jgi:hypothetical protein
MYENGGGSVARFYHQTAFNGQGIVPQTNLILTPNTPPKVVGPVLVDQALPTSAAYTPKQHITLQFSEHMRAATVDANTINNIRNNITVQRLSPTPTISYTGSQLGFVYDAASHTAIITFPGAPGEELADGNWRVTLNASAFQDADAQPYQLESPYSAIPGNALDGNGDGTAGDNYVGNFYVLKGDTQANYSGGSDPNRKIDFTDYQRLELNYGKGAADRVSAADGDFNHDGVINDADFVFVRGTNMGKTLPAEPVIVAAPTPVPVQPTPVKTKPVAKPAPVKKAAPAPVAPKTTVFASKKITGVKDLLSK